MRIILLLVVLTIIGLISTQWIGGKQSTPPAALPSPANSATLTPPPVPTRPQDLKQFEQDMNRFMQNAATQRDRQDQAK